MAPPGVLLQSHLFSRNLHGTLNTSDLIEPGNILHYATIASPEVVLLLMRIHSCGPFQVETDAGRITCERHPKTFETFDDFYRQWPDLDLMGIWPESTRGTKVMLSPPMPHCHEAVLHIPIRVLAYAAPDDDVFVDDVVETYINTFSPVGSEV